MRSLTHPILCRLVHDGASHLIALMEARLRRFDDETKWATIDVAEMFREKRQRIKAA